MGNCFKKGEEVSKESTKETVKTLSEIENLGVELWTSFDKWEELSDRLDDIQNFTENEIPEFCDYLENAVNNINDNANGMSISYDTLDQWHSANNVNPEVATLNVKHRNFTSEKKVLLNSIWQIFENIMNQMKSDDEIKGPFKSYLENRIAENNIKSGERSNLDKKRGISKILCYANPNTVHINFEYGKSNDIINIIRSDSSIKTQNNTSSLDNN